MARAHILVDLSRLTYPWYAVVRWQAPDVAAVEELTTFLRAKSLSFAEKELQTVQEYANENG